MAVDWLQVLFAVLWIVEGFFAWYFRTKTNIFSMAAEAIDKAEKEYADVAKGGSEKMRFCVQWISSYIPLPLKPFITEAMIEKIVQSVFNYVASFAEKQLDKIVFPENEGKTE